MMVMMTMMMIMMTMTMTTTMTTTTTAMIFIIFILCKKPNIGCLNFAKFDGLTMTLEHIYAIITPISDQLMPHIRAMCYVGVQLLELISTIY